MNICAKSEQYEQYLCILYVQCSVFEAIVSCAALNEQGLLHQMVIIQVRLLKLQLPHQKGML